MKILKEHLGFWEQWGQVVKLLECDDDHYFMVRHIPGNVMYDEITRSEFMTMKQLLFLRRK